MIRYLTTLPRWCFSASLLAPAIITIAANQPASPGVERCETDPAPQNASSLLQVASKDPTLFRLLVTELGIRDKASAWLATSDEPQIGGETKTSGMQAWLLLTDLSPDKKWPADDHAHRNWSRLNVEVSVGIACAAILGSFICFWLWNQRSAWFAKEHARAASVAKDPDLSESAAPSRIISRHFRNESELLAAVGDMPLNCRHVAIFICATLGFCGAGGLNDTIGLTFSSFEEEWGPQTPSRLASLSLVSTTGQIAAVLYVGNLCDLKGRCFVVRWASLLIAVCCGLCAVAPSIEFLAGARFIGGLGYGSINVAIPTLLSECVPMRARCLLVLYQFGWPLGAAIFTYVMSHSGWRAAMLAFMPSVMVLLGLFWCPECLPESPKWLCSQGRLEEASDAVVQLGYDGREIVDTGEMSTTPPSEIIQAPPKPTGQPLYIRTALSMLCVSSASTLIKVWLPQVLSQLGVRSNTMAFVTMWVVEASALIVSGLVFGVPSHSVKADNVALLRVAQVAFIVSGISVLGYFKATNQWLISVLGCFHLLGQSNAANFLMAFATLSFPVTVRARCVAGIFLASYAGYFVGPLLGAILLQGCGPRLGAYSVLSMGSFIYACGYFGVLGLANQ